MLFFHTCKIVWQEFFHSMKLYDKHLFHFIKLDEMQFMNQWNWFANFLTFSKIKKGAWRFQKKIVTACHLEYRKNIIVGNLGCILHLFSSSLRQLKTHIPKWITPRKELHLKIKKNLRLRSLQDAIHVQPAVTTCMRFQPYSFSEFTNSI